MVITNMAYAWGVGTNSLTSRLLGEGKGRTEDNILLTSSLFSLVFGLVLAIAIIIAVPLILPLSGVSAEVIAQTRLYLLPYILGVPVIFLHSTGLSLLRAEGKMQVVAMLSIGTTIFNALLDVLFIRGFWFIPPLGVVGVGVGSITAKLCATVTAYWFLLKGADFVKQITPTHVKFIFKIAIPVGLAKSVQPLAVMVLNGLLLQLGQVTVAARGLGTRIDQLLYLPAMFFTAAVITLIANLRGAGRPDLIRLTVRRLYLVIIGLSSLLTALFLLWPELLWDRVTQDRELMLAGYEYVRFFGWSYPLAALDIINNAILQGLGFGYPTLVVSAVRIWGIALPCSYLFGFTFNLGATGVWLAFGLGNLVAFIASTYWVWRNVREV